MAIMKGSIQSIPTGSGTGQIDGNDGVTYEFYLKDFSPEDIASGLEELESVTFEAVPGGVSRAMNCVRLRAASPPTDALDNTASASDTSEPAADELPLLYSPPVPTPLLCKGQLPPEWEIISISEWCVRGSSKNSTDEARRIIVQRARELKANAILNLEHGIVGESSKTYFFQGRLAIVGKRDRKGQPPEMLAVDLSQAAEGLLSRLESSRQSAQRQNYTLYAVCAVVTLAAGGVIGFASLPALIVGAIALGLCAKLSKDTTLEECLVRSPIVPPTDSEVAG